MIYGLYLSAQGAQAQSQRQEVVSNNLANASTTAFKRDLALFQAHRPYDSPGETSSDASSAWRQSTGGVSLAGITTVFQDAALLKTDGALDLALTGPGFFRVSDGNDEFLTRNGKLARDAQGQLVTQDSGHAVLSTTGAAISIPDDVSQIEVAADGTVFQVGPDSVRSELGQIDIVRPDSTEHLEKVGNSFYRTSGRVEEAGPEASVQQGFLETSGIAPVQEMMSLIESSRAFEANINMIRTQDETLAQLLQSVGGR